MGGGCGEGAGSQQKHYDRLGHRTGVYTPCLGKKTESREGLLVTISLVGGWGGV